MKKLLAIIALVALLPFTTSASLYHYYDEQLPSIEERAIVAAELGIWGYEGTYDQNILLEERLRGQEVEEGQFGASVVSRYRTRLSSSMTSTQTTVPVSSITTFDGHTLTMDDLDGVVFFTIEPGSSREEIVKCTSVSGTAWGTCTRGLAFYGKTETSVSANRKAHNSGSIVVMSNVHFIFEQLVDKDTSETITGLKTYNVYPESGVGADATTTNQFVTFGQANALTNAGAATSTESLAGIGQVGTQLETASTTFDISAPTFLSTKYSTSSPDVRGIYSLVSENDGYLNQSWIDLTENFVFTGDTTVASTTFNASTTWDILPEYTSDPIGNNEAARKSYVDNALVTYYQNVCWVTPVHGNGSTNYLGIGFILNPTTDESDTFGLITSTTTVDRLYAKADTNGINNTTSIDFRKNGADTALDLDITTGVTAVKTNLADSISLVPGDTFSLKVSDIGNSGSIDGLAVCARFKVID